MSAYTPDSEEFYVGYLPEAPKGVRRFVRIVLGVWFLALVAIPVWFAAAQRPFSSSVHEFGSLREITGFVVREPVPMLRSVVGRDVGGERIIVSLPLVGAGKFGAEAVLDDIAAEAGRPLDAVEVTLRGTLIYHDGKALFELTEGEASLVAIEPAASTAPPEVRAESLGRTVLRGEIVDSKCYFGVMKPGLGKPHRSCAIRCIAGGIPPVLMVRNADGEADYLLLVAADGEPIGPRILDQVAESVEVEGDLLRFEDWLLLRIDPETGIRSDAASRN